MKKLLCSLLFFSGLAWSATTTNLGLALPQDGDADWGTPLRSNFTIIDASAAIYPLNLNSGVTGTLPAANTVSSTAYTSKQNTFTDTNNFQAVSASSLSVNGPLNTNLTPNQCVQVGAAGILTTSGAGCSGGGGSGSPLGVNQNGVPVTTPTFALNGLSPPFLITAVGSGATAQWALSGSSVTLFGTNVIKLQETLQANATFFVSSGTILGQITTNKIVASTLSVSGDTLLGNLRVTGTNGVTVDNLTSGRCVQVGTNGLLGVAASACAVSGTNYSQSFTAQTSVVLAHNTNTTSIVVSCYDNATPPNYIGFNSLALTDTNSATVTFASAQTGTCVVSSVGGGGDNLGNHIATTLLTANYGITTTTITASTATFTSVTIGTMTVSSGTFNNVIISTLSWIAQPSSGTFAAERCGKELQFTVTTASSTPVTAGFVPTNLSGTITPHSTASYIKIRINGDIANSAGSTPLNMSINRNSTDLSAGSGFAKLSGSGTTLTMIPIMYDDSPVSVNPITYTLTFLTSGGTVTFCNNGLKCVMILQECF